MPRTLLIRCGATLQWPLAAIGLRRLWRLRPVLLHCARMHTASTYRPTRTALPSRLLELGWTAALLPFLLSDWLDWLTRHHSLPDAISLVTRPCNLSPTSPMCCRLACKYITSHLLPPASPTRASGRHKPRPTTARCDQPPLLWHAAELAFQKPKRTLESDQCAERRATPASD